MSLRLPLPAALFGLLIAAPMIAAADTPHGIDLAAMDKSVAPGDDFYNYANGSWLKRTEIPAGPGALGRLQHPQFGSADAHPRPDRGRGQDRRAGHRAAQGRGILSGLHG